MNREADNTDSQNVNGHRPTPSRGVILLAHGSQRGNDTSEGLQEMVRRLQSRLGNESKVVMACLEFIKPDLVEAVASCVDLGLKHITVMPFLLGQGTHTTEDLEEEIERSLEARPEAKISASPAFGCDPALAGIVVERVLQQTSNLNGAAGSTKGVLLVKAGTRSPTEDHVWLNELGAMVEQSLGSGYAVDVAQSHFGSPTMEEAISALIEKRGASSVICVPYIFFPGLILTRNIVGGIEESKQKYLDIAFSVTPTLGIDDRLVELTAQRIMSVWDTAIPSPSMGEG